MLPGHSLRKLPHQFIHGHNRESVNRLCIQVPLIQANGGAEESDEHSGIGSTGELNLPSLQLTLQALEANDRMERLQEALEYRIHAQTPPSYIN